MSRKNIKESINGITIESYFGNTLNKRQVLKDKASATGIKLNDSRSLSTSLKDGIDGFHAKSGFDLFDLVPNLPLRKFFWYENVPVRYGGGFAETVNALRLSYGIAEGRMTGTQTNERTLQSVVNAKITVPVYAYNRAINITEYEIMKSNHINYDIMSHNLEALQISYQRELEHFAFVGNLGVSDITENSTNFHGGLLNLPATLATKEYFGSDWLEDSVNIDELVKQFVKLVANIRVKLQFGEVPNTALFPTSLWTKLLQPAVVGETGTGGRTGIYVNNLDYLEQQLSRLIGEPFYIRELPYLDKDIKKEDTTAGIVAVPSGEESRVVIYRNTDKVFRFNVPMALTGGATYLTDSGWNQNFISLVTPPLIVYPSFAYIINGTE